MEIDYNVVASKKYVDEKMAICEHNYHILRGDFNEFIRKYKEKTIGFHQTEADIYERLVNIRKTISFTLALSITSHIILFILWVALWKRF